MKKLFTLFAALVALAAPQRLLADHADVVWPMTNKDNLSASTLTAGAEANLTPGFTLGANLSATYVMTGSNADAGFSPVTYDPVFVQLTPSTRVTSKTAGHCVTFTVTPGSSHTFKPTTIEFDAVKCGTDGGNFDVYIKNASGGETALATAVAPLRNKIQEGNATGYSHHTYTIADQLVQGGKAFQLILYVYNFNGQDNENPKSIAFRNVTIGGEIDEPIWDASHYFSAFSCSAGDLLPAISALGNGQTASWPTKLYGDPTDFSVTAAAGFTATATYNNKVCTLTAYKDGKSVFTVYLRFIVSYLQPRGEAKPLNRGLMALKTDAGVLVSWRLRATDNLKDVRFRLYRDNILITKTPVMGKTNYLDTSGKVTNKYSLQVVDTEGNVLETQEGVSVWDSQTKYITLQGGAPKDPTSAGATYTPNDASFCDMDGDGEYEIVLKWAPSNEKDAAGSGTTSPAFYGCYKLDGTRLWMLHTGANMFNSAHTAMFIAWDLDGDGYGEFMVKTAPGAIDGEGNYVLLGNDDPTENLKSGRGKQDHGSEYITVFDGLTGAELQTIPYHTAYADFSWGDEKQNRSERYLVAIAWLDGEQANPSAIFARGYYNGCRIGAYDWDGSNLTLRWLHSGESSSKGTVTYANGTVKNLTSTLFAEGAHWISIGDVTGDGKQEIHYGSGALKPDGTTLYRTGLGHGDAIHLGDFIPSRPGLEYFMAHEEKSSNGNYGVDLRDARTGEILVRRTAGDDTGRGLMAHFNPESDDAYFMDSADGYNETNDKGQTVGHHYLYNTKGEQVGDVNFGTSGASINNRLYWDGTLADDYYDKGYLAVFNPNSMSFDRQKVNGAWYTAGNLNNGSKNNPCVLGDLLGDWREEIVNWAQSGSDYQLVINATNYQTPYGLPHLMDDYAYRAQVISQNCAYNQPPHLSYNPIARYTIEKTLPASGVDVFHTTYPVILPAGVTAYNVTGLSKSTEDASRMLLKKTALAAGATLPAGASVILEGTPGQKLSFRPTTKSPATVSANYLKACAVDSILAPNTTAYEYFYELQTDAESGVTAFVPITPGKRQPGCTPWLRVKGTASNPPKDVYYLKEGDIPVAIDAAKADASEAEPEYYNLNGQRLAQPRSGQPYIQQGRVRMR